MKEIDDYTYNKLLQLGIIEEKDGCDSGYIPRSYNVGESNYSKHFIQPWSIWIDYPELTSFDHDIIKRVLRTKNGNSRRLEYEKIIHICEERIRQIETSARIVAEVNGTSIDYYADDKKYYDDNGDFDYDSYMRDVSVKTMENILKKKKEKQNENNKTICNKHNTN